MNYFIAEHLKSKIETLSFADKVAGLVRPTTANIDGGVKIFPVGVNVNHSDCVSGKYNDLMPNSKYKSVMYFEDLGAEPGEKIGDFISMTSRLKLVIWLDMRKINGESCPDIGSICPTSELMKAFSSKAENMPPVSNITVSVQSIIRDKNIFSEYTYDEKYSQYLFFPFDYFAMTLVVKYKINVNCLC